MVSARPTSPNAGSLFQRCARTLAPAIPLSQAHLSLRLSRSPLPPPLVSLAMTQYTIQPHGPHTHRSISTIHIQTLNLTAHHPSSSTISTLMSCIRTNTNTNTTTTTSNNNNNNKIPPRVSIHPPTRPVVQPLTSFQSLTTLPSKLHLRLRIVRRRILYTILQVRRPSPPCFLLFLHSTLAM